MKKQISLKLCLVFLLLSVFSMLVIGCKDEGATKFKIEKGEVKQLMENNIAYTSKGSIDEDASTDINTSQTAPINNQIQMEQWRQLIGDLKTALADIREDDEQAK
jgi:hypothetical protein